MTSDTRSSNTTAHAGNDFSEFKRGWRVVVLGLFGICTSITAALLYAFGTLVIPLEQAFGWSRGDLQASITFLFAGVGGRFDIGGDRVGDERPMIAATPY